MSVASVSTPQFRDSQPHSTPQVAYYDEDNVLVTSRRLIAANYLRSTFWLDLLTTVPFDWIVLLACGMNQEATVTARYIGLLRLLRLGRVYRLRRWMVYLTNDASLSLFWVTMGRNILVLFYTTHIAAWWVWVVGWWGWVVGRLVGKGVGAIGCVLTTNRQNEQRVQPTPLPFFRHIHPASSSSWRARRRAPSSTGWARRPRSSLRWAGPWTT
jgi:hypothetical protein